MPCFGRPVWKIAAIHVAFSVTRAQSIPHIIAKFAGKSGGVDFIGLYWRWSSATMFST